MGESAYVGGEAHRDGGPSPNLSGRLTDGRPPQETPDAPASTEAKPAGGDGGYATLFEGFEQTQIDSFRDTLARGLMSPESLQRAYGLSAEELAELTGDAPPAIGSRRPRRRAGRPSSRSWRRSPPSDGAIVARTTRTRHFRPASARCWVSARS